MFQGKKASWCEVMKLVPACWRADFCRFIEEGEASDRFLAFLEEDERCRRACEMVLRADEAMVRLLAEAVPEEVH